MIRDNILRLCLDAGIDFPLLRNAYCDINGLPRGSRARVEVSPEQVEQVVRAAAAAERETFAQVAADLPQACRRTATGCPAVSGATSALKSPPPSAPVPPHNPHRPAAEIISQFTMLQIKSPNEEYIAPSSPLQSAMANLDQSITDLADRLQALSGRLEPVLTPVLAGEPESEKSSPVPVHSMLVDGVGSQCARIRTLDSVVSSWLGRLEI